MTVWVLPSGTPESSRVPELPAVQGTPESARGPNLPAALEASEGTSAPGLTREQRVFELWNF